MNRRDLLSMGVNAAALASAGSLWVSEAQSATPGRYQPSFPLLDRFVEQYLRDMNAPGLTLVLADATGVQRVCAYGLDNLATRRPLDEAELFHIGSITKSFTALCLLQLHDEGKLDFHRPIAEYLPWIRFDAATRPITPHDLLTHGAALPDGALFPADPTLRHKATAAPGTFFHYCNMGFEALGLLIETLDKRSFPESVRARILVPLGMTATEPVIALDIIDRLATSYTVAQDDRSYPRLGALAQAPAIVMTEASGSIASTARDMGAYLSMLINRGRGGRGRLVSEAAFKLFSTPHIAADEFGPDAKYGYGIAVDTLDGHARLRHTGGMVSFASALEVDLDSGTGVFAAVNSMQGYRPRPVAEYALKLMRACKEDAALPAVPAWDPALAVAKPHDYAGRFVAPDGRSFETFAEGDRLFVVHQGTRVPAEPAPGVEGGFIVHHADFARFVLVFSREGDAKEGPFVEAGWGGDWYATTAYRGAKEFPVPADWHRYVGHYRNEDPWIGSALIVIRRGRLWLNGTTPLEAITGLSASRFWLRDEAVSPEWLAFSEFANGHAMRMSLSGNDLKRV
jgi:CubicO group peptidase (beta-lactamase class C family)